MIKIDTDGDTMTDAQVQVYTGNATLTYDDILLCPASASLRFGLAATLSAKPVARPK